MFRARFDATECAGQMKFARQRAIVAGVSQQRRHQGSGLRPIFIAIATSVNAAGVHAGQEAGAAGRANRALAKGAFKGDACGGELVDIWRIQLPIVERADCVIALLIAANP